jgi:TGF-beta propeptide
MQKGHNIMMMLNKPLNMRSLIALAAFSAILLAGCTHFNPVTSTSATSAPTGTIVATIEQSAYVNDQNGTFTVSSDAGYLEYLKNNSPTGITGGGSLIPTINEEDTYIQFNLSQFPGGHTIAAATLEVYIFAFDSADQTIVDQITQSWDKTTLSVSQPGTKSFNDLSFRNYVLNNWNYFDITSLVQAWATHEAGNYGLKLYPSGNGDNKADIYDHDNPTFYPRLVITYFL